MESQNQQIAAICATTPARSAVSPSVAAERASTDLSIALGLLDMLQTRVGD
jgi:hypothetical protein